MIRPVVSRVVCNGLSSGVFCRQKRICIPKLPRRLRVMMLPQLREDMFQAVLWVAATLCTSSVLGLSAELAVHADCDSHFALLDQRWQMSARRFLQQHRAVAPWSAVSAVTILTVEFDTVPVGLYTISKWMFFGTRLAPCHHLHTCCSSPMVQRTVH